MTLSVILKFIQNMHRRLLVRRRPNQASPEALKNVELWSSAAMQSQVDDVVSLTRSSSYKL